MGGYLEGDSMQTLYYTTENFIRHTGNVVDLTEYRRRLARTQQEQEEAAEEVPAITLLPQAAPQQRLRRDRTRTRHRRALFLDACASMGVVVMTLTFTLRILAL